jgi:hypothetical protein
MDIFLLSTRQLINTHFSALRENLNKLLPSDNFSDFQQVASIYVLLLLAMSAVRLAFIGLLPCHWLPAIIVSADYDRADRMADANRRVGLERGSIEND